MTDRFPGYDVLAKRSGQSWNDRTREVIDERLALSDEVDVLSVGQRAVLRAVADRIAPQPRGRAPVNTVAILLDKIGKHAGDGFRHHALPAQAEAWAQGLDALDAEARSRHAVGAAALEPGALDALLSCVERGEVRTDWKGLDPKLFWRWRLLPDLVSAYWAHPSAWSAMGFGGPASPRGYVRMDADRRDPWEAAEEGDGSSTPAAVRNACVD